MISLIYKPSTIVTIEQAIEAIRYFRQVKSSIELREFLQQIESEDEMYRLIRLLDSGKMYDYATFIAKRAHTRFNSTRTFTWLCHSLLDKGRPFNVERMIAARLDLIASENGAIEDLNEIRKIQLTMFCMMNRIPEAEHIKKELEEAGGHLSADRLASYLVHIKDYAQAEEVLQNGLELTFSERGDLAFLYYATLLSNRGDHAMAISVLQDGQKRFPDCPGLYINRVIYHYHENELEKVISEIPVINEKNPFHVGRPYFISIQAQALYRLERWEEFVQWVEMHKEELGKSFFGELEIKKDLPYKELLLNPIKQKVNYCVPASISMILNVFDIEKTQDEIAEHVFDVTGSKISTTVNYMHSLGFESKFFKGTIDRFKKIIDEGVPILLELYIENGSHVQIVKGYDDRIGVLIIQDPNSLHSYYVRYDKFDSMYKLKDNFSIIFFPIEKTEIMSELPEDEHVFFGEILQQLDWSEENEEDEDVMLDRMLACFEKYQEDVYPAVLGLTYLRGERVKPYFERWRNQLKTKFSAEDSEVYLIVANSYLREGDNETFTKMMEKIEMKTPYTQFLIGLFAYKNDDYSKAIANFERSLELDPFQPVVFAYLAECYRDVGFLYRALNFVESAAWQDESNEYIRSVYASILLELNQIEKALDIYTELFEENQSKHAYYAYEIGRCHRNNDNVEKAKEWFMLTKAIDPLISFPYLQIAEIHMDSEEWQEAEEILLEGVTDKVPSAECCLLWQYIGHARMNRKQYEKAEQAFNEATVRDVSGNNLSVVHKAKSIFHQGDWERATLVIRIYNAQYELPEVLFHAGAMMWDMPEATETDEQAICAIDFMEEGLQSITENIVDYVRRYVVEVDNVVTRERVLKQVISLRKKWNFADIFCIEAGVRGLLGQYKEVKQLLNEAILLEPTNALAHFRFGILYKELGDVENSIQHFLKCLECDDESDNARDELVQLYAEKENYEEAKRYGLELIQTNPTLAHVPELVEWLDDDEKDWLLTRILELEGVVEEDWRLLSLTELIDIDEALTLLETTESLQLRIQYVYLLHRKKDFKKSFKYVKELVKDYPENEYVLVLWSDSVYELKKYQRITFTINNMNVSKEDKSSICRNLAKGLLLYVNGLTEQRIEADKWLQRKKLHFKQSALLVAVDDLFKAAYKYEPDNFKSYLAYGEFLFEQGEYLRAYYELNRFHSKYDDADVRQLIGLSLLRHGLDSEEPKYLKKAMHEFEVLANTIPNYYYAWLWIADTHFCLESYELALLFYNKSIDMDAENPDAYVGVLMTNYFTGLYEEVISMFDTFDSSRKSTIMKAMDDSNFELQYLKDFLTTSTEQSV